jgi:hypothetical protein
MNHGGRDSPKSSENAEPGGEKSAAGLRLADVKYAKGWGSVSTSNADFALARILRRSTPIDIFPPPPRTAH